VKFRGSYQRAARAANIVELFTARGLGLFNADEDPCAGATPTASAAACARTGVSAGQYGTISDNPAGQYNALLGGNPNLKPESSDSYTFGLVFSPMRNLNASIDYFDIKVKDVISALSPTQTLNQCLATGDAQFCSLITRDRLGTLWATPAAQIVATNLNLGRYETQGLDFAADYGLRIGSMGNLDFSFQGTYLKKFLVEEIPGLGTYDCVGLYGSTCGNPLPKWRHKVRATWATPWKVEAALTWRHIASVDAEGTSSDSLLNGPVDPVVRTFGARNYFDLSAMYPVTKNITIRGSVNNLFDKDPPLASTGAPFGNGNTYPQVYDTLGRRITLTLTAKF
jgi:outer membrane receptor protein involved in Fe transport